ncbi:hypothetical protein ACFLQL_01530 [Verrucomicrobiota bacterium]
MLRLGDVRSKDRYSDTRIVYQDVDIGGCEVQTPALPPPLAPTNPIPADGASNQYLHVTMSWERGGGIPSKFLLNFGPVSNWPNIEYFGSQTGRKHFNYDKLEPFTEYTWRVIASNYSGTATSEWWLFETGEDYDSEYGNVYVSTNGLNRYPYSNWTDAARSIKDAVRACDPFKSVIIGPGIYTQSDRIWINDTTAEPSVIIDKPIFIKSVAGSASTGYGNPRLTTITAPNPWRQDGDGFWRWHLSRGFVVNTIGEAIGTNSAEGMIVRYIVGNVGVVEETIYLGNDPVVPGALHKLQTPYTLTDERWTEVNTNANQPVFTDKIPIYWIHGQIEYDIYGHPIYDPSSKSNIVSDKTATIEGLTLKNFNPFIQGTPPICDGGAALYGGVASHCIFTSNEFSGSSESGGERGGGGAAFASVINDSLIGPYNYTLTYGGGVLNCLVYNSRIFNNEAGHNGIDFNPRGGGASHSRLFDCLIDNNNCSCLVEDPLDVYTWYAYPGGGAYLSTLDSCTVVDNIGDPGGGVYNCKVDSSLIWAQSGWSITYQAAGSTDFLDIGVYTNAINYACIATNTYNYISRLSSQSRETIRTGNQTNNNPGFLVWEYTQAGEGGIPVIRTNFNYNHTVCPYGPGQDFVAYAQKASNPSYPYTPYNLIPSNVYINSRLQWTPGLNSAEHHVYFSSNIDDLVFLGSVNDSSIDPELLKPETEYYWRVDSDNSTADSTTGTVWNFRTRKSIFHYASTNGAHVYPFLTWPDAATNIQSAIDACLPGDTVWVNDGIFNAISMDEHITVRSLNGPDFTTISGNDIGNCVGMNTGTKLEGFNIINGFREDGGAGVVGGGEIYNCYIHDNYSEDGEGGGVSGAIIYNSKIYNNYAYQGGGAAYSYLYNCSVYDNAAVNCGGAYESDLYSCTVVGNYADNYAAISRAYYVYDTIAYYNNIDIDDSVHVDYSCFSSISNTLRLGTNNITSEPLFVDYVNKDFNLTRDSLCVTSGIEYAWMTDASDLRSRDLANNNRIGSSNLVDIGAYAFWATTNPLPSKAVNPYPISGAVQVPISITSTWDTAGYTIYYSMHLGLSNNVVPYQITDTPSNATGRLRYGREYEWIIDTINLTGITTGDVWNFSVTGNVPYKAINPTPTNSATDVSLNTAVTWEDGGMSESYRVQFIYYGSVFTNTESTYYIPTNRLAYDSFYQWKIFSSNFLGVTTGDLWNFTTASSSAVHYVSAISSNAIIPYSSWLTAATNIQDAIDESYDGDTIWVTNGVYTNIGSSVDSIVYSDCDIDIRSMNGATDTIIKGTDAMRCVTLNNSNASLWGFTLLNGRGVSEGGGVKGGKIYNCAISNNSAVYGGGAFNSVLVNCIINSNYAYIGAGVYGGSLYNCELLNNISAQKGGGVSDSILYNSLLSYNASYYGGASYNSELYNCTIISNTVDTFGAGTYSGSNINCISWGNSTTDWLTVSYNSCGVGDGYTNNNCITDDPIFSNSVNPRLTVTSPCKDTGTNRSWMSSYWLYQGADLDTNNRIFNSIVDMGAYEYGSKPWSNQLPLKAVNPYPGIDSFTPTNIIMIWEDGYGDFGGYADGYNIYFGDDTNLIDRGSSNVPTYTPVGITMSSNYSWRIDSTNIYGVTTGDVWTFSSYGKKAKNPYPTNTATDQIRDLIFGWENGGVATSFNIYYGKPPLMPFITNTTSTNYTPATRLSYHTNYQWRIDSLSDEFGTTAGDVWTFQTTETLAPLKAKIPVPADNRSNVVENIILGWLDGGYATSFKVYVAPLGDPLVFYGSTFNRNLAYYYYYQLNSLVPNSYYEWRIDAVNVAGTTVGDVWTFKVRSTAPPSKATSPSPASYERRILTNAVLSWTHGAYATSYELYFGPSNRPVYVGSTTNNYYNAILSYDNTYYTWRVNASNEFTTARGSKWRFYMETLPAKTTLISPDDDSINQSLTETVVRWTPVNNAVLYNVWFGLEDNMSYKTSTTNTYYNPGTLLFNSTYEWKISPLNYVGLTDGDTWSFDTEQERIRSAFTMFGNFFGRRGGMR